MTGPGPVAPGGWQGPAGRVNVHAAAFNHVHAAPMAPVHAAHEQQLRTGVNTWARDFAQYNAARNGPQQRDSITVAPGQVNHHHIQQPMAMHPGLMDNWMQPNLGLQPVYGPTNGGYHDPALAAPGRPAREAEFNSELNNWMAVHGDGAAHAKAMEDVDAIMEQIARDLELQQATAGPDENAHAASTVETFIALPTEAAAATGTMEQEQTPLSHTLEHTHFTDLGVTEMQNLSISAPAEPAATTVAAPVSDAEEINEAGPKAKSEVAQAAERLLDSLKDEDGDKWKNSTFLSLMRDFADGKKDIVDNEVRDTDENAGPSDKDKQPGA
jgi:hypothetical protein